MVFSELESYLENKTFSTAALADLHTYLETLPLNSEKVEQIVFAVAAIFARKGMTNNVIPLSTYDAQIQTTGTMASLDHTITGIGWIISAILAYNASRNSDVFIKLYDGGNVFLGGWVYVVDAGDGAKHTLTWSPMPVFIPATYYFQIEFDSFVEDDVIVSKCWRTIIT